MSSIDSSPSLISSPPAFQYNQHQPFQPSPNKLFVGGISWRADEAGLFKFFSAFGNVLECKIIMDRNTLKSKGYGFITFENEDSVTKVKNAPNLTFMGKNMNVGDAMRKSDGLIVNNLIPTQQLQIVPTQHQSPSATPHNNHLQHQMYNGQIKNVVPDENYILPTMDGYDSGYVPGYYVFYDVSGAIYQQVAPYQQYYSPYMSPHSPQSNQQYMYAAPTNTANWRATPYYSPVQYQQQQQHSPTPALPSPNGNNQSLPSTNKNNSKSPNLSPSLSNNINVNHNEINNVSG